MSVKRVELANLATDPAEVIDQARQGHRVRAPHLVYSFLRYAGLSLITPQPDTQEPLSI